MVRCVEFYNRSSPSASISAHVGYASQWSDGSSDKSDTNVERLDWSNIVSSAGVNSIEFFEYHDRPECHNELRYCHWFGVEHAILLACECGKWWWDEYVFQCVELYHRSSPSGTISADIGDSGQWSDGSGDEPDTGVERIDGSDVVPPAGIDGCRVCDDCGRSEQHNNNIRFSDWTGREHVVLLACECDQRWGNECVFDSMELHHGWHSSRVGGGVCLR